MKISIVYEQRNASVLARASQIAEAGDVDRRILRSYVKVLSPEESIQMATAPDVLDLAIGQEARVFFAEILAARGRESIDAEPAPIRTAIVQEKAGKMSIWKDVHKDKL